MAIFATVIAARHNPLTVPLSDLLAGRLADYVLDHRSGPQDDHG